MCFQVQQAFPRGWLMDGKTSHELHPLAITEVERSDGACTWSKSKQKTSIPKVSGWTGWHILTIRTYLQKISWYPTPNPIWARSSGVQAVRYPLKADDLLIVVRSRRYHWRAFGSVGLAALWFYTVSAAEILPNSSCVPQVRGRLWWDTSRQCWN